MKRLVQKLPVAALALFFLFPVSVLSQNLTGIWRGYFVTEHGEQYKFELQIEQTGKNGISGVSYSYLDTRFYGKATLTGNFNRSTNFALVQEIKTVEVKMSGSSVACIMKCNLKHERSGDEQFLEGTFSSIFEKTDTNYRIKRGGDCGDGRVYLRKVTTSDFYIEPFLRNKTTKRSAPVNEPNSTAKTTPPSTKPTTRPVTKPVTKPNNSTAKNTTTNPNTQRKNETISKVEVPNTKKEPVITNRSPIIPPPAVIKDRSNELVRTIQVTNPQITVRIYDNGEIDDDTVSVYMNNKLVLLKKKLTAQPLVVKFDLSTEDPEHDLVMVAENLGRIPPNTSLMIVQDGDKRYEVRITSTEQKNAMVRFRYTGTQP